jgi:hypothetical protein
MNEWIIAIIFIFYYGLQSEKEKTFVQKYYWQGRAGQEGTEV